MLKKDVTKKMLEQIAEAMNEVMGLDPPIETGRKIKRQDLFDDVLDASLDIQPEDLEDEAFTDDILKWLKVMGWEPEAAESEAVETVEETAEENKDESASANQTNEEKKPAKKKTSRKKESNINLAIRLLKEDVSDEEFLAAFEERYDDPAFAKKRAAIYKNIAKKNIAKTEG